MNQAKEFPKLVLFTRNSAYFFFSFNQIGDIVGEIGSSTNDAGTIEQAIARPHRFNVRIAHRATGDFYSIVSLDHKFPTIFR